MLVLSRRSNESIVIAGDITVTILEIRGDQVRLGIDAPRSVTVHREEVHAEIQRANQSAASVSSADIGRLPRVPKPS
jgi:carbon storage regulator